jgi:hypothetical protein
MLADPGIKRLVATQAGLFKNILFTCTKTPGNYCWWRDPPGKIRLTSQGDRARIMVC